MSDQENDLRNSPDSESNDDDDEESDVEDIPVETDKSEDRHNEHDENASIQQVSDSQIKNSAYNLMEEKNIDTNGEGVIQEAEADEEEVVEEKDDSDDVDSESDGDDEYLHIDASAQKIGDAGLEVEERAESEGSDKEMDQHEKDGKPDEINNDVDTAPAAAANLMDELDKLGDAEGESDNERSPPGPMEVSEYNDNDVDVDTAGDATVDDLFGDAGDISESDEEAGDVAGRDKVDGNIDRMNVDDDIGGAMPSRVIGSDEEEAEDEEEEEGIGRVRRVLAPPPETRVPVEIPYIAENLGNELHFVKLPNFLSVDTRPFDPLLYEDEVDDGDVQDEEGRARLKLKVENTMRWRVAKDDNGMEILDEYGDARKESNARIVRWSDNSLSLYLGKEIFDVHTMPLTGDFNHLFIRMGNGLLGQSVFRTKLAFRPHSTDSITHRKMTLSLADRSKKKQQIRVIPVVTGHDPEAQRSELLKKEEERLRADLRRQNQQRRVRERQQSRGLSSTSYLEGAEEDEEETNENSISLKSIKQQGKLNAAGKKRDRSQIYSESSSSLGSSSDEEEEGRGAAAAKSRRRSSTSASPPPSATTTRRTSQRRSLSTTSSRGAAAAGSSDSEEDEEDKAETSATADEDEEAAAGGSESEEVSKKKKARVVVESDEEEEEEAAEQEEDDEESD